MHIKEKEEVLVEMQKPVSLKERSRDHVKIYFQNTQDEEIKRMLPMQHPEEFWKKMDL